VVFVIVPLILPILASPEEMNEALRRLAKLLAP
jgi:hypothetical protein